MEGSAKRARSHHATGTSGARTLPWILRPVSIFYRRSQSWPDAIKWRIGLRANVAHNLSGGKFTGWLGTIISKAVRALAARLVQRQRIFVTTPWLICSHPARRASLLLSGWLTMSAAIRNRIPTGLAL